MTQPIVAVSGLGRCGTSLTMQMFHAIGVPCVGTPPAFEPAHLLYGKPQRTAPGRAVKWLDPTNLPAPFDRGRKVFGIWLVRDFEQQARSAIKMGRFAVGSEDVPATAEEVRLMADFLRRDDRRGRSLLQLHGPTIVVAFEDLVGDPRNTAFRIVSRVRAAGLEIPADAFERAAAVVLPRGPECQPGLDIEARLIARYDKEVPS